MSALTSESLDAGDEGRELTFPEATAAVSAVTSGLDERFIGLHEAPQPSSLDVLLWPEGRTCEAAGDALYPSPGGGQALAYHAGRSLVLVAGGNAGQSSAVVGALTFRVDTGEAEPVDASARHVLLEPRAFAAAAPFGQNLIVTGGENPVLGTADTRPVQGSAEVFLVDEHRFSTELVELRVPRARHAAIELSSGEVLLVGGRAEDGSALAVLEAISPTTNTSSLGGLASLEDARIAPRVVRLWDGRLLVGGGENAEGEPVSSLEWLSSDAERALEQKDTERPAYDVALSEMPGGGALFVAGCAPTSDDSNCAPCERGCPTPAAQAAFWVRPTGELDAVELPEAAPHPELVPAADGAPWLFTGNASAPLFRFNPWRARFEAATLAGEPAQPLLAPLALDASSFVWLASNDEPRLFGVRTGLRNRYARDLGLLVQTAPLDSTWPLHLAPGRARTGLSPFDGSLRLQSEPTWLTDVDFADVDVTLEADETLPIVWLSFELPDGSSSSEPFGGTEHPWPEPGASDAGELLLERRGQRIVLSRGGASATFTSEAPAESRVRIGFSRAEGEEATVLERLAVLRRSAE